MATIPDRVTIACTEPLKDFCEDSNEAAPGKVTTPIFEIKSGPGRGRGLFALKDLAQGSLTTDKLPFFTLPNVECIPTTERTLLQKVHTLTSAQQAQFHGLHDSFTGGGTTLAGIVASNVLPTNSKTCAIYPTFSLLNHGCVPNAHYSWNENLKMGTLYVIGGIEAGEELTMGYGEYQRGHWNFVCSCAICTSSPSDISRSDIQRSRIITLETKIDHRVEIQHEGCLQDLREMKDLLQEIYGDSPGIALARVYFIASEAAASQSDLARARVFAERAYRARLVCEGEDHPLVLSYGRVRDNSALHYEYASTDFRDTKVDMKPVDLEGEEFEDWLWTWE